MSLSATTGQTGTDRRTEHQEAETVPPSYEEAVGVADFETGIRYDGEDDARMAQLSALLGITEAEEAAPQSYVTASSAPLEAPAASDWEA